MQSLVEDFCREHHIAYDRDVPLSAKTTFKAGGPADLFITPENEAQLSALLSFLSGEHINRFVLGKGSNVVFADEGFRGAVIHIGEGFGIIEMMDDTTVYCGSGAPLSGLCRFALERELSGLEFAYGIPGSVGGAIYMNAGAYGGEIGDVLRSAKHLHHDGFAWEFAGQSLGLSYRHSAYVDSGLVITGAVFVLKKGNKDEISATMEDFMNRRRDKQPLDMPSAGSTFKRPLGGYASALIDQCGLKERSVGGAMVSGKHAGFIVNTGGATCADIIALIKIIREEVAAKTGFTLEPEIQFVPGVQL